MKRLGLDGDITERQDRISALPKALLPGLMLVLFGFASPIYAQSQVQYVYDPLSRLTQVIDPSGNVATYNYDAIGNLLSITRSTTSPNGLAIVSFSPGQGSAGQTVTIQGQNFSTTPSANAVQFNGTAATVTVATANSLTTTVPTGATTGPISITVGASTATSSTNFTVLTTPAITSVSPTLVLNTPTVNFTVNGSNLIGATFSFLPAFSPAALTVSNVNINGNGTSVTMTLTLTSSASGSFTAVATTSSGSSSQIPSTANTLTVLSGNPTADFDGDGLTNIYEAAIATNYANFSITNDGLPDGWALFYTSTPPLSSGLAGQNAPNGSTYLQNFQQGLNPLIRAVVPGSPEPDTCPESRQLSQLREPAAVCLPLGLCKANKSSRLAPCRVASALPGFWVRSLKILGSGRQAQTSETPARFIRTT